MTELKRRRRDSSAHPEDADADQAHFRADLDCMIESAEGVRIDSRLRTRRVVAPPRR